MAPEAAPRRRRGLVLTFPIAAALISTVSAYFAMVSFGTGVLAMDAPSAYALSGVFELTLLGVALLAREAAIENRPNERLLTITWALSAASGAFAASHEIHDGHGVFAAVFRFLVPLLAALMWHLVLVGDAHLASGRSLSRIRAGRLMHTLFIRAEEWIKASGEAAGSKAGTRAAIKAEKAFRRARSMALRNVPPDQIDREVSEWEAAFIRVNRGIERIGALSVVRSPAADEVAAQSAMALREFAAANADALALPVSAATGVSGIDGGQAVTDTPRVSEGTSVSGKSGGGVTDDSTTRADSRVADMTDMAPSDTRRRATASTSANRGGQAPGQTKAVARRGSGAKPDKEWVSARARELEAGGAEIKEIACVLKAEGAKPKQIAHELKISERTYFRMTKGTGSVRGSGASGASRAPEMEQPVTVESVTVPSTRGGVSQLAEHHDVAPSDLDTDTASASATDVATASATDVATDTAATDTTDSASTASDGARVTAKDADTNDRDGDEADGAAAAAVDDEKHGAARSGQERHWHKDGNNDTAASADTSAYELIGAAS